MKEELLNILKTQFIGKNIIYYDNIDSTQLEAKRIKDTIVDGTILIANNQTSGIGTHGRNWYMGKGDNIAFTIVLKPKCNMQKISNITILIAQCMVCAIEDLYGNKMYIKEPNDLMYSGKKIGGILTQAITQSEIIENILIGIGLNVNQIYFPPEIENIATSLKKEFGKEYNRIQIIAKFLSIFEKEYIKIIK